MRDNKKMVMVVVVLVLLVGISAVVLFSGKGNESNVVSVPSKENMVKETEAKVLTVTETSEDEPESTEEAVMEEAPVPTPREGLESTDPSTVNLVSGEPQLVELFAFW